MDEWINHVEEEEKKTVNVVQVVVTELGCEIRVPLIICTICTKGWCITLEIVMEFLFKSHGFFFFFAQKL